MTQLSAQPLIGRGGWDVAILGGGPAGCATAIALARLGITGVCLVTAPDPAGPGIGETLPPGTRVALQDLGLWDRFLGERHEPCLGSCSAWGSDQLGYNDFVIGGQGSGWHLDRDRFDRGLREHAGAAGATLLREARLTGCARTGGGFRLRLGTGVAAQLVTSRVVVDATGARCAVARRLGAVPLALDRLQFVYGFFGTAAAVPAARLTMVEATPDGWWYSAQLPGQQHAVAFASDPDIVRRLGLSRPGRWLAALLRTRHIARRLDGCRFLPDRLTVRGAHSFLLDSPAGAGWLAVGDAASAYDPMSSQGLHKAMLDAPHAAEVIAAWLRSAPDAAAGYAAQVRARFQAHLRDRNYLYEAEARWPATPFWSRRHRRRDVTHQA